MNIQFLKKKFYLLKNIIASLEFFEFSAKKLSY